jgi:hypothetical protein
MGQWLEVTGHAEREPQSTVLLGREDEQERWTEEEEGAGRRRARQPHILLVPPRCREPRSPQGQGNSIDQLAYSHHFSKLNPAVLPVCRVLDRECALFRR